MARIVNSFVHSKQDDSEELGSEYDVDGAYVPRLYFFGMFI